MIPEQKQLINEINQQIQTELQNLSNDILEKRLNEPYNYLIKGGGKRVRSLLTIVTAGMLSNNHTLGLKPAVAVELLHNFSLVHDDIMDNSPTRRNRPTIHTKWDNSIAILLGDIIIGLANKEIIQSNNVIEVLKLFTKSLIEVCRGQALDMEFNTDIHVKSENYFEMTYLKTASLIQCSMMMGGAVAFCSDETMKLLEDLGNYLGIAFQLQDDLLDIMGNEIELGKRIGNDIVEGKKTYMMIRAKEIILEHHVDDFIKSNNLCSIILDSEKELVTKFYQNNGLEMSEIELMREILIKYGIIEDVKSRINKLFEECDNIIDKFPKNLYTEIIKTIISQLLNRQF